MSDGSELPQDTRIYLLCDGAVRRQAPVVGEGEFSFALGSGPSPGILDASVSGTENDLFGSDSGGSASTNRSQSGQIGTATSMRRIDMRGCSVQAYAPGFRSSVIHLGARSTLDKPHVGDLFLEPIARAATATVSATRLAAPKDAVKSFAKAVKEFGKQDFEQAARELEKAVKEYPEYAEAWQLLGAARNAFGDTSGALDAYHQAHRADPDFVPPMVALSRAHVRAGQFNEAARLSGRVIEISPTFYDAYYIHSLSHYNLGNLDTALESVENYMARPDAIAPTAHLLMGFVRAERHEFADAAAAFEVYLGAVPEGDASDHARQQLAQWRNQGLIPATAP